MTSTTTLLRAARFAFPGDWYTRSDGTVYSWPEGETFDLDNQRDREKVLFKLKEHGWTVTPIRRGKAYEAKHTNGVTIERPVLDALLVDVIERVQGEG